MTSRSSKVLTTNVRTPSFIAWYYNEADGTSRFYVLQYNDYNVKIFDEFWATVGTIGSLKLAAGIIISPVKTLWLADQWTQKINEFDLDGKFLRNVLSDLVAVLGVSYHPAHPRYVWVTFYDYAVSGYNAKRFKIY